MTIEKYSRADEGKVKVLWVLPVGVAWHMTKQVTNELVFAQDLTLKLEHCSEEMQRRKKALDSEVTDTITAQVGGVVHALASLKVVGS